MIKLHSLDLLPFFECDPYDLIRSSCEVKSKSSDLIDSLLDFPDTDVNRALTDILGFLVDVSQFFADVASDRVDFDIYHFACCRSRFSEWYQNLDDLVRHGRPSKLLRSTGFSFRSLYFSCRDLDEVLSQYFSDWVSLHPDIDLRRFPSDWSRTSFEPAPPALDIDFDPAHYIF